METHGGFREARSEKATRIEKARFKRLCRALRAADVWNGKRGDYRGVAGCGEGARDEAPSISGVMMRLSRTQ
jgi:hypothetical protein